MILDITSFIIYLSLSKELLRGQTAIYKDDALVAKYAYDAYGCTALDPDGTTNTTKTFVGNINPFRYGSYYFDIETGLYYIIKGFVDIFIGIKDKLQIGCTPIDEPDPYFSEKSCTTNGVNE